MIRSKFFQERLMEEVLVLRNLGCGYLKISRILKVPRTAVNHCVSASNAGFSNYMDYLDSLARREGYDSFSVYSATKDLLRHPQRTAIKSNRPTDPQKRFERRLSRRGIRDLGKIIDESSLEHESEMERAEVVYGALAVLRSRNERSYEIVRRNVMEGETLEDVAKSYGVSREAVRQQRDKSVKSLGYIIKDMMLQPVP